MIRAGRSLTKTSVIASRNFSNLLLATEKFPYSLTLTPQASAPAVVTESRLANGMKLITRDCFSPVVSLKFAIYGGSGAETEDQKGAAQLLSVAAFQGGNGEQSGMRVVRALENLGATIKSSVDREKIVYDVTVMAEGVGESIDVIMQSIASPPFLDYVLEELKPSVKIFYDSYEKDSEAQVASMLHEAAYGELSTLGAPVYGNLKKLHVSDVLEYRAKVFVAENVVITANGISTAALESLLGDSLEHFPTASAPPSSVSCPYVGGVEKVKKDLNGATYLGLAFPIPAGDAAKPYSVLQSMLKVKGLKSFVNNYSSGGLLGFTAAGTPSSAASILESAVAELKAIATKSTAEVDAKIKKVALSNMLALEGGDVTGFLLKAGLADRSVTAASVSAAAAAVLKTVPSYAVLGKTAGAPSYATISQLVKQ